MKKFIRYSVLVVLTVLRIVTPFTILTHRPSRVTFFHQIWERSRSVLHESSVDDCNQSITAWRFFSINVPVRLDPGKDHHEVHKSLLDALASQGKVNLTDTDLSSGKFAVTVARKSFDSRSRNKEPQFVYAVDVSGPRNHTLWKKLTLKEGLAQPLHLDSNNVGAQAILPPPAPSKPHKVVIVGAGPAGLFAALHMVRAGLKPVILERGKAVEERGQSIGALFNRRILDGESNLCYGEGGAGTWSDGKLTTRIGKNSAPVRDVLESLVSFGAPPRILVDGKPHLGTDRLVKLLKSMRAYLVEQGAEIIFNVKVKELTISSSAERRVTGVVLDNGQRLDADSVLLAVGHSARSLYSHLHELGVALEAKSFAAGFRIEHPQDLINRIQYGQYAELCQRGAGPVPVADYHLAVEVNDGADKKRGCYSFCMCPGGQIVPTSVSSDELCINGMSFSKRQSRWANSALVVTVTPDDVQATLPELLATDPLPGAEEIVSSPLSGVLWQRLIERRASRMGGGNLVVPVQRATDFIAGLVPDTGQRAAISSSYRLGVREAPCHELFPKFVTEALRTALSKFDRRMPGFLCDDAILHGVETRTSAPVQVRRSELTCESLTVKGLFPAGEGAGYAGGIVSAAVDGARVAQAILSTLSGTPPVAVHSRAQSSDDFY